MRLAEAYVVVVSVPRGLDVRVFERMVASKVRRGVVYEGEDGLPAAVLSVFARRAGSVSAGVVVSIW